MRVFLMVLLSLWVLLFADLGRAHAQAIVPQNQISLFNGASLSGLYPWFSTSGFSDPNQVFRVEDGMLHVTGNGAGALTTNSPYRDYVMVFEFRWGAQTWGSREGLAKNSGLLFHSRGVEGGWQGLFMPSVEAQLLEGSMGDVILLKGVDAGGATLPMSVTSPIEHVASGVSPANWNYRGGNRWKATGSPVVFTQELDSIHWSAWDPSWEDVEGYRGQTALESPDGQWNQMVVICNGNTFEIFVNGTIVNGGTNVVPSEGKIQLEAEWAEFYVRRWELHPLGSQIGPSIRNDTLPAGTAGQPYAQQVGACAGTGTLHWSITSGSLPPGVTLDTQTGALSGTPPQAGAHAFTVTVTDDLGKSASQDYLVPVNDAIPVTSGLVLHLDSTQGVSTPLGNTVAVWADVSGNGKNLSGVNDPQWGTVLTPTGVKAIHFDGVNDRMQRTTSLTGFPTGNSDRTMFLVAKYNSATASGGVAYGTDNLNESFALSVKNPGGQLVLGGYGSSNDLVSTTAGMGAGWLVQSGMLVSGVGTLFKDGAQIGQFTHTYNTVLTKMMLGADLGNQGYVGMDVAAVLLYNRALSGSERAQVDAYLRSKYVVDTTPPTIVVPANLSVEATGSDGAVVSFGASAVDAVSGVLASVSTPASGSLFPLGTTTVNTSAVDAAGNPGNGSFTVTVVDTTPPVITLAGANPMVVSVGATFIDPGATAMDSVDGNLTSEIVVSGGPVETTMPGSYTLTYNVSDAEMNAAVPVTRTLNVVDTTPPVITVPADLVVQTPNSGGATITFTTSAIDYVDGVVPTTNNPASGSLFPVGTTTVTTTATDAAGNIGSGTFTVTVVLAAQPITPQTVTPLISGNTANHLYTWSASQGLGIVTNRFSVQDGTLHVIGNEGGGIFTTNRYRDYVLVFEFKWGPRQWGAAEGTAKNTGILLHSRGYEGGHDNRNMPGLEMQLAEGSAGDFLLEMGTDQSGQQLSMSMLGTIGNVTCTGGNWNCRGGHRWVAGGTQAFFNQLYDTIHWYAWDPGWLDVTGYRGAVDFESADGQWNQVVLDVQGGRVSVFLNGTKVNEILDTQPSEGKVQIEVEGSEYFVRRWELHPLGSQIGPSIRNDTLPAGTAGQPYAQQVGACAGTGALHWSITSGSLPPGVTLDAQTGALSGTPPQAGAHAFTVTVTDDLGKSASQDYLVPVNDAIPVTSGLVLHLDSTQGVSTPLGNTVTVWADVSGNGKNLSGVNDPQWGTVLTPTGVKAIHFDGVNDRMQRTTSLTGFPTGNSDRTMFVVAKYNSATASGGVAYGSDNLNQAFALSVKNPGGQLVLGGWGSTNDLVSTTAGMGAGWLVQSGMLAAGVGTLFKDGAQIGQFTHTYNTVLTRMVLGADLGNQGYVGMDVAAVLLYNRALSGSERAQVDAYLRSKYVVDTTPPTIVVPANLSVEAAGSDGAVVSFSTSAVDAVSGILAPVSTPASGSLFPLGTTTVNTSAVDAAGNLGNGSFTVTVVDTTPPVITLTGANPLTLWVGEAFTDPGATAVDLVDGDVTPSIVPGGQAVDIHTPGSYTRTYTAADASANMAEKQRTVEVVQPVVPRLQFEFVHNETDDLLIGFDSVYGLDYELHTSTNLIQWELLDTIPGDGLTVGTIHLGGAAGPRRFYKVIVIKPAQ